MWRQVVKGAPSALAACKRSVSSSVQLLQHSAVFSPFSADFLSYTHAKLKCWWCLACHTHAQVLRYFICIATKEREVVGQKEDLATNYTAQAVWSNSLLVHSECLLNSPLPPVALLPENLQLSRLMKDIMAKTAPPRSTARPSWREMLCRWSVARSLTTNSGIAHPLSMTACSHPIISRELLFPRTIIRVSSAQPCQRARTRANPAHIRATASPSASAGVGTTALTISLARLAAWTAHNSKHARASEQVSDTCTHGNWYKRSVTYRICAWVVLRWTKPWDKWVTSWRKKSR